MIKHPAFPLALLLAALFMVAPVFARLGETPEQCDERYGSKYTETAGQGFWAAERQYEKGGIRITIRFLRDQAGARKAEYIEYKPLNTTSNRLTEAKTEGLLQIVSRTWIPLTLLTPPPQTHKPAADPSRTLGGTRTSRIITLEKATGEDKRRAEKEAKDRKDMLDQIAARNKVIQRQKEKIRKITGISSGTTWKSPEAYASGTSGSLAIFSTAYMNAYDHQAGTEKARKAKEDATPFTAF